MWSTFVGFPPQYAEWLREHPAEFVIISPRMPRAQEVVLHRASCALLLGTAGDRQAARQDDVKACGQRDVLEEQFSGSHIRTCQQCLRVGAAGGDGQTGGMDASYSVVPIGWVQSELRSLDDAPRQRDGAPRAWIRFDERVAEGTKDLRPGDEIVVLTWLHLSPRDELSTHPQDDLSQPLTGVFSTCSPNRPNPIGLHRARIVAREGLRIEVDALEAIDNTPVVDVKPALREPA